MTKRRRKKQEFRVNWQAILTDPLAWQTLQQILALLIIALGVITLLTLFQVTKGRWTDAWVDTLWYFLGWGAYPAALAILLTGLLWIAHQLDRPLKWRWRPFVGVELVFFGLLALTHTIIGQGDLWALVGERWGGGLVGWATSAVLSTYLGWPAAVAILLALSALGMGFAFDVTAADVKRIAEDTREILTGREAPRPASSTVSRERPRPSQPAPPRPIPRQQPTPQATAPSSQIRPSRKPTPSPTQARPRVEPTPPPAPRRRKKLTPPPIDLLNEPEGPVLSDDEIRQKSRTIEETLAQFGLPVEVTGVRVGPTVTQFGIKPGVVVHVESKLFSVELDFDELDRKMVSKGLCKQFKKYDEVLTPQARVRVEQVGSRWTIFEGAKIYSIIRVEEQTLNVHRSRGRKVRVSQISALADDLALALAAPRIRIEAPVPGRSVVGIEVPNDNVQLVGVREVMDSEEFRKLKSPLAFTLGRDVAGDPVVADLARMPHLLIAGTTGSGKSVCIKALTTCLVYNNTPDELRLVMIDPKMVELVRFNGLPHLYGRVEVDLERVVRVLRWVALEMDDRYRRFAAVTARNLDDYNRLMKKNGELSLPRIVVLVDELADLMMLAPDEVERTICRIAQMARATGIHLVMATQRPSTDVVTGLIKANFPARISFATVSQIDSRVILDMPGAETLMGRGDMLYLAADAGYPVRVQGCFVSEEEIERIMEFWREQTGPAEAKAPWEQMMRPGEHGMAGGEENEGDELLEEAITLVQESGRASASLLQRKMRIGHPRAARLIRLMEERGVIGPSVAGGRTRSVIIGGEGPD